MEKSFSISFACILCAFLIVTEQCRGDATSNLNDIGYFNTPAASSDTLYVNSPDQKVQATDASMAFGDPNSHITVSGNADKGTVAVASVTSRAGESLYKVNGIYIPDSGGSGGGGGQQPTWNAKYKANPGQIKLDINTSSLGDNFVTLGSNGGTLVVSLQNGDPGTSYTVSLGASSVDGAVTLASSSVTVSTASPSASVNITGTQVGGFAISGTCTNGDVNGDGSANVPNCVVGTVVSVSISPVASNLLSGGLLCLNAQDDCKKATWKATIAPSTANLTATVSRASDSDADVSVPSGQFHNNENVLVSAGTKTGTYRLVIKLSGYSQCQATSSDGTAFKFLHQKKEPEQQFPGASPATEEDPSINASPWCKAYAKSGSDLGSVHAFTAGGSAPNDAKTFYGANLSSKYDFYIKTEPANAYTGNVRCNGYVRQYVKGGGSSYLRVFDSSQLVTFLKIAAAWDYEPFSDVPLKISASADWMHDKSVVAGFVQGIGVTIPGQDMQYAPEQQVQLSQADIGFGETDKSYDIPSPPEKGWTNGLFKANDTTSVATARHDMCVSSCRGDVSTQFSSLRGSAQAYLDQEIIQIETSNFNVAP